MRPTIFVINRKHQTVQQNILRALLSRILSDIEGSDASIYPNELIRDFICIAQMPGLRIGIYESFANESSFAHELDFFAYKSCDIIFCHTAVHRNLSKKLSRLEDSGHVDLVVFDKIWLDALSIKSLEEYEVEKLLEIIQLRLEDKATYLLKNNDLKHAGNG